MMNKILKLKNIKRYSKMAQSINQINKALEKILDRLQAWRVRKDKATEEDTAETQEIGAEVSPGRMRDLNPKIEWEKDRTDPPALVLKVVSLGTELTQLNLF
jgi:hypothetical protein